ncbi:PREDICTED: uncharacterized protein LOC109477828 [Branchiostoma belcheri]|uniref:Uncharacterized protein LOC109477828 n=1 Tax=Branchiostoma belcheri TaxID=7741 RepID=A0A6P4YZT0_BRABE|nr:PREDICTED: uncharacterized protein LOC109477828 [Branchiostoma belcheri]KAI8489746.1 hypothetical protein Bbelb_326520 [Branchiostoma belcheri]
MSAPTTRLREFKSAVPDPTPSVYRYGRTVEGLYPGQVGRVSYQMKEAPLHQSYRFLPEFTLRAPYTHDKENPFKNVIHTEASWEYAHPTNPAPLPKTPGDPVRRPHTVDVYGLPDQTFRTSYGDSFNRRGELWDPRDPLDVTRLKAKKRVSFDN